jgi:hypothetical protein
MMLGCDECERELGEGAEAVVAYEDDDGLHALPLTYCLALADILLLLGLLFHRDCYEVARFKDPPLSPPDSSG